MTLRCQMDGDMELENLTAEEKVLLQRVAEHLRQFRASHLGDDYQIQNYHEGILAGIEMAKNEIWRLTGSRPF